MNLICFPHYAAGGLLCEILNSSISAVGEHGGFTNDLHNLGKIGDSDSVFDEYDVNAFYEKIATVNSTENYWIGTHCWPGLLDLSKFTKIINITTVTYRSKLFRWARAYELYFKNSDPVTNLIGQEKLHKIQTLAKNYIKPFLPVYGHNVINIEFSSIVDYDSVAEKIITNSNRYEVWRTNNAFLYNSNLWNSDVAKWLDEAEYKSSDV